MNICAEQAIVYSSLPTATYQVEIINLSTEHQPLFQELYCDGGTMQNIAPLLPPEDISKMFQRCLNTDRKAGSNWRFYVLKSRLDYSYLGMVSRLPTTSLVAPTELGILLTKNARGKGIADQALATLIIYCFNELDFPAVMVRCHPQNKGACQLNIRLGFDAAPAELQDQSGLLCWWMPNTPQQQKYLMQICTGQSRDKLSKEKF